MHFNILRLYVWKFHVQFFIRDNVWKRLRFDWTIRMMSWILYIWIIRLELLWEFVNPKFCTDLSIWMWIDHYFFVDSQIWLATCFILIHQLHSSWWLIVVICSIVGLSNDDDMYSNNNVNGGYILHRINFFIIWLTGWLDHNDDDWVKFL